MKAAIVGAGEIGTAVGKVLREAGTSVALTDKEPGRGTHTLHEALHKADAVFFAVSSQALHEALRGAAPFLETGAVAVIMSKGFLSGGKAVDTACEDIFPSEQVALFMGPMLAEELKAGKRGAAVAASVSAKTAERIQAFFAGTPLYVELSSDVRGVALAGALKNVYAIGLGIVDTLGAGRNSAGKLVVTALREMGNIIAMFGGEKETALGLAGLGDLVATGFSEYSKNFRFGREIARGEVPDFVSEGSASLHALTPLLGGALTEVPLLSALWNVVVDGSNPRGIMDAL